MQPMYYVGLDIHKRKISYCVKNRAAAGFTPRVRFPPHVLPANWGLEMRRKYTAENYHKPSDKIEPDWDMSGAVEDAQLYFLVGYQVSNSDTMPEWKPGTEFKPIRDAALHGEGER